MFAPISANHKSFFSTPIYTYICIRVCTYMNGSVYLAPIFALCVIKIDFSQNDKQEIRRSREVCIFTHNLCGPHSDNKNGVPEEAKNMHKVMEVGGGGGKARGSEEMQFFLVLEVLLEVL